MVEASKPLPERVTIYEVGPRDGLQNESALVPTDVKAEFVRRLLAAGLPVVEATSFVHPKWVPQLADAAELMTALVSGLGDTGRDLPVLVPNERGLERALELGLRHVAIFGSATETFAQKNLNRSLDEQFEMFEPTVRRAREHGLDVRAYVSMCFGDPWEGAVPIEQVVGVGKRLFDLGASQLSIGDTIGVGTAGHVTDLVEAFVAAGMERDRGPGVDADRPRHRARRRSAAGRGDQRVDGRAPRATESVGRRAGPGRITGVSRRVYLHIGAPKTGTTYLQDRLALNAKTLAEHDVHFPTKSPIVSPGLFQFRAALDLLDQDWGGKPGHARGSWDALVRKVRRMSGTVVISHEILAPATPDKVAKAKQDLAGAELHIVYSARDLGRQLPAAWQESIKQGRKWNYRRYLNRVEHRRPWFARAFDLPAVLGTWSAGLSPAQVHVVTVPHERGDELWRRFCDVFGIDPAWAPEESTRHNESLGVAETQLIRQLNRRMDRVTRRETTFDWLIRRMLAQDRLVQRRSAPLLLPPRMHPWARDEADRWIDWIKGSGIDVVGELDDLYPAPPVPEDEWVDPDKVGPKKQLAAALDALSAMTREAARRPDPDDALVARIRRATRRE